MCFTVNVNIVREELESRYGTELLDPEKYRPSYYYHAFAFPELPVVIRNNQSDREIRCLRWGLIPGWVSDAGRAAEISKMTHNARCETIEEKPSFSDSFRSRRGLCPVRGFFEWQHTSSGKLPWYIYDPSDRILSLAAIYDTWIDDLTGKEISTFSILTTAANEMMAGIHNTKKRMPVIIDPADEEQWLSGDSSELGGLFVPPPDNRLKAHRISPAIGNSRIDHNHPAVIAPFTEPDQATLF